jgi:hypothetical protein
MMIRVVSTFTTIQGSGQVDLKNFDDDTLTTTTIRDIKVQVESLTGVPATQQSIWWKGYILDDDAQSIHDAIRQFPGHSHTFTKREPDDDEPVLTLYMTVPVEERYQKRPSTSALVAGDGNDNHVRTNRLSSWDFKLEDVKLLFEQKTS